MNMLVKFPENDLLESFILILTNLSAVSYSEGYINYDVHVGK